MRPSSAVVRGRCDVSPPSGPLAPASRAAHRSDGPSRQSGAGRPPPQPGPTPSHQRESEEPPLRSAREVDGHASRSHLAKEIEEPPLRPIRETYGHTSPFCNSLRTYLPPRQKAPPSPRPRHNGVCARVTPSVTWVTPPPLSGSGSILDLSLPAPLGRQFAHCSPATVCAVWSVDA